MEPEEAAEGTYDDSRIYPCSERNHLTPFLCQPREIRAPAGRNIDTCFRIDMRKWCKVDIATTDSSGVKTLVSASSPSCTENDQIELRTYGSPKSGNDCSVANADAYHWSIPGPTFHLLHPRAATSGGRGQGYAIKLHNRLPEGQEGCREGSPPGDELPNCFHGENVTNLHFHGFRVSPEEPQDYVFLKLPPQEDFQYRVDPITELQPPGTHWYHPHKHGSTAIQVANGMAGAFAVHGYLDDAIRRQLGPIREQVMMIQQIFPNLAYFPTPGQNDRPNRPDRSLWVNGMSKPIVEARAGEIQWWRMVAAMQQTSSQFILAFPFPARQIAQDGIPFSPENYGDQPLDLSAPEALFATELFAFPMATEAAPDAAGVTPTFHFAAGNRVDVLIQAPAVDRWPPRCLDRGQPKAYCDFGANATRIAELMPEALEDLRPIGDLLTLRVYRTTDRARPFPTLPERPDYLRLGDITDSEVGDRKRTVVFSADKGAGNNPQPPNFCIDGNKYKHDRIDHCLEIGTAAEWRLENRTPTAVAPIAHPFHIHTNPFQLVATNDARNPDRVWFDTFPLPTVPPANSSEPPNLTLRHRFVRFAGEYVLHCHILGHEDRGMMQNVKSYLPGTECIEGEKEHCDTCPCS